MILKVHVGIGWSFFFKKKNYQFGSINNTTNDQFMNKALMYSGIW